MILSLTLSTACQSPKIVTVEKAVVPEITFPVFPLADGMTDNKDGTVTVPGEWIVRLEEYHILIQKTEAEYDGLREIYGKSYEQIMGKTSL